MREKLPDRRATWTQHVQLPDANGSLQTFYLSCSDFPDGRLGEVWLEANAEGTFTRGILSALARMISIALQHGVPVAAVVGGLRGLSFPPSGPVTGSARVTKAASVADWVASELEATYLPPVPADGTPVAGTG